MHLDIVLGSIEMDVLAEASTHFQPLLVNNTLLICRMTNIHPEIHRLNACFTISFRSINSNQEQHTVSVSSRCTRIKCLGISKHAFMLCSSNIPGQNKTEIIRPMV